MKKTVFWVALALIVSAPAFAEKDGKHDGKPYPERKVERLKEKLSLSDEQAAQIKSILESKQAKMEALQAETRAEVDAVLTPEQKEKHAQMKKEMKDRKHGEGCDCPHCAAKSKE